MIDAQADEATKSTTYILGHLPEELRRLELQATILRPMTMRLLNDIGVAEGMHVLDIGTGVGDVAILVAERVGPSSQVVAIDRNEAVLRHARARAEAAGLVWLRSMPSTSKPTRHSAASTSSSGVMF